MGNYFEYDDYDYESDYISYLDYIEYIRDLSNDDEEPYYTDVYVEEEFND